MIANKSFSYNTNINKKDGDGRSEYARNDSFSTVVCFTVIVNVYACQFLLDL